AVPFAVSLDAPLLLGDETELADVLTHLGDPEVRTLPTATDGDGADGGDDSDDDVTQVALAVADELGTQRFVAAAMDRPGKLAGAAVLAARTGAAVLPLATDAAASTMPPDAEVVALHDLEDAFAD